MNYIKFPCELNTKVACVIGWQKLTKSHKLSKFPQKYSMAYKTGKDAGFFVLDIDLLKKDQEDKKLDGYKQFLKLKKKLDLDTYTVRTPSRGLHLYFKYDPEIKTARGVNGYSIDIRSDSGYAMVYDDVICDSEITEIPAELKKWIMPHYRVKKETSKKQLQRGTLAQNKNKYIYLYDEEKIADALDELSGLDSKYVNGYDEWFPITSALKSEGLRSVWDEWSQGSGKYDEEKNSKIWDGLNPKINIDYLNSLFKKRVITKTKKLDLFTLPPTEKRCEKYVDLKDFDFLNNRILLIKSGTGTGKTTATVEAIKKINKNGTHKVLSTVSRVSLAQQHTKNFNENEIKIKNYTTMNDTHMNQCNNLVVQLDSIIKLHSGAWENCILYVDEINSLIDYLLNSSTLNSKRLMVWNMFMTIVKNCSYLIGVDADISDNVIYFFRAIEEPYHLIHNTFKNCIDKKAVKYTDKNKMIDYMKGCFEMKQHFVACFDSLREQDIIIQELRDYCGNNGMKCEEDFLIYSSKDGDDKTLVDVTAEWTNRYVFYSPKIVYGLDFNNKKPIEVFFMGKSTSVNPLQYSQMVARTRNIKRLHFFIEEHNTPLQFDSPGEVKEHFEDMIGYYQSTVKELEGEEDTTPIDSSYTRPIKTVKEMKYMDYDNRIGEYVYSNRIFEDLFYRSYYYDHVMRSAMSYHFEEILKEKGYTIVQNKEEAVKKINEKKLKKKVKETHDNKVNLVIETEDDKKLTASERKLKDAMKKRSKILNVNMDDEEYKEELSNDRVFLNHINMSNILKTCIDEKLIQKDYNDSKLLNVKSSIMKIKLIKTLEKTLKIKQSMVVDYEKQSKKFSQRVSLDEKLLKSIQKTFRLTVTPKKRGDVYNMLMAMYRNVCKGAVETEKIRVDKDNTAWKRTIKTEVIERHLSLVNKRNTNMNGYDIKAYGYKIPSMFV